MFYFRNFIKNFLPFVNMQIVFFCTFAPQKKKNKID